MFYGKYEMSELIREIKSLSSHQVIYSLAFITAIISPGLLIIFTYKRELFLTLDIFKLLLLSVSLSVPILICTLLMAAYDSDGQCFNKTSFFGCFICLVVVYPILFLCYFMQLPFSQFAAMLVIFCLSILFLTWRDKTRAQKKKT